MTIHVPLRLWDDGRARRIGQLIAIVCLLSGSDLLFTLWAHTYTAFHELNPLARALLRDGQLEMLVMLKLVCTAFGAAVFWRVRHRGRAEMGLWMVVVAYVLLALRWADYTVQATGSGV